MASTSTLYDTTENNTILTPVIILDGHEPYIISLGGKHHKLKQTPAISYFLDGKQMISGSGDMTIRRWDLREGKEIEKAREVCWNCISAAVGVSRDGRWVVTTDWEERG